MEDNQPKQLQVNISQDAVKSLYSDIVFLSVTPFGITLDFGQQLLAAGRVEIVSRVSVSPQHAKLLAEVLGANVKEYEKQFGEIKITEKMKKAMNKKIGF